MNINNIQKAIAVMERAKAHDSVYMNYYWQVNPSQQVAAAVKTEEEFHACGNKACFGGHIAISPEWKADGGTVGVDGSPVIAGHMGNCAIAYWLGVKHITGMVLSHGLPGRKNRYPPYPVLFEDVKAEHVIFALNQLLELGEEKCLSIWL